MRSPCSNRRATPSPERVVLVKFNGVLLKSVDEVSFMAYRPRVMLSQLHNFKRRQLSCSSMKVPSKFQMLTVLVDMVRLCVGKQTDATVVMLPLSDVSSTELLSLGWEGSQTFPTYAFHCRCF